MKKFSYLMMGFAALSFAACSSDEPAQAPSQDADGTTMYLNINITDANKAQYAPSRAYTEDGEEVTNGKEGDYEFGSMTEHDVNRADFLFYDAAGRFITRANVWKADGGTQAPNIEYMGTNTLVLRNLTKNNLPAYLITVLNAPVDFSQKVEANNWSMDETRKQQFEIRTGDNFVMSTTSFFNGNAERYDNEHYYATKLKTTDFMIEPPTAEDVRNNAINVYVERLAAKFSLKNLSIEGTYPVDVTIAGLENGANGKVDAETGNVEDDYPSASTTVYVKILGYGLTGQEKASYLSKNLDGFAYNNEPSLWENWNNPGFYRSFWGKSLSYGEAKPNLNYCTFAQAKNDPANPIYGYETTNTADNIRIADSNALIQSNVTNILITAAIYADEECTTPLDLVEFNGVYFTKDQYMKYVLGKLLAANGLQYWKDEVVTTGTETQTDPDGKPIEVEVTKYSYTALSIDDFTCDWAAAGQGTGSIVIKYTPAEGTTLYKKGENYQDGDRLTPATANDVNAELAAFNEQSTATAFNGGSMFYTVPIEHLLSTDQTSDYKVYEEGNYGIVRNHWYQLTINKVLSLGHGVFNPGDEDGEELVPPNEKEQRFALAAKINILSWKIVEQGAEL